jgi:hypothetical protein
LHKFEDLLRLAHPPSTHVTAGENTSRWFEDEDPPATQGGKVLLHRGLFPHFGVHGGTEQYWGLGRQQRCGKKVVRQSHGVSSNKMCRRRSHDNQVGALAEVGVRDRCRGVTVETGTRGLARERGECHRSNETCRVGGEYRRYVKISVTKTTKQINGLVGGDAASNA